MDYWICSRNVHFIACYFDDLLTKVSTLMQLTGHIILKIKQMILGTEFANAARYTFSSE